MTQSDDATEIESSSRVGSEGSSFETPAYWDMSMGAEKLN
jgi:hypothetical protein